MVKNKIETGTGFVVLLDALGMKEKMKREESLNIIEIWNKLIDDIEYSFKKDGLKKIDFDFRAFSDTLIIVFKQVEYENDYDFYFDVQYVSRLVSEIFLLALHKGLLLRGAISHGEYCLSENMIAGRAMNEVAAWYDQFELIGIILTPNFSLLMDNLFRNNREYKSKPCYLFKEPPIIFKNGKKMQLWIINWVHFLDKYEIIDTDIDKDKVSELLFQSNLIDPSIAVKYDNTYQLSEMCGLFEKANPDKYDFLEEEENR